MKIIIDKDNYVDLEKPIDMTEEQKRKFLDFFKNTFDQVKIKEILEPTPPGPSGEKTKEWKAEDYKILLETNSNEEVAKKLDRSVMSIRMKRGGFQPEFLEWARERGYAEYTKENIKKFFEKKK